MSESRTAGTKTFLGVGAVALATLAHEILLTRIFSVAMWYHFAFMAISIAMFGMTAGAIAVFLRPRLFAAEHAPARMAQASLLFAGAIVACFFGFLAIPYKDGSGALDKLWLPLIYVVSTIPYFFSGVAITLALTKFPAQVSRLYAYDLAGAALGCLVVVGVLKIADGPTAVLLTAAMAAGAAWLFASEAERGRLRAGALAMALLLGCFCAANTWLYRSQKHLIRLKWVKGADEIATGLLYEKWNSFSRIRVYGDGATPGVPQGWGLSDALPKERRVRQLAMDLDAAAGTVLTQYDGDPEQIDHLRYDVTNVAHYLRPNADVLVVGAGGGRDVLSALAFGQKSVEAVEINGNIVKTTNKVFGDFTGHLDRIPGVSFVHDEARSHIARTEKRFDILQISLIDTWAATAAGAFVMTENTLYTVEAFRLFLSRLTENGVLSVSRWHYIPSPGETRRLAAVAIAALRDSGAKDPRAHLLIAKRRNFAWQGVQDPDRGIANVMVSRTPFSEADIDELERVCAEMDFDVVLSPRASEDDVLASLASASPAEFERLVAEHPVNIAPTTDDNPFFFHMLRPGDLFRRVENIPEGALKENTQAIATLGTLLLTVFVLSALCIALPLLLATKRGALKGAAPFLFYFAGIGLGFMLVEIALMQRLVVFLGHPTYGLVVALFTLLVASGAGSYLTGGVDAAGAPASAAKRLGSLLLLLVALGFAAKPVAAHFEGAATPIRIALAALLLAPAGLLMGMAFPLGMKAASTRWQELTPWFWGINGAMSVSASVLAVAISLAFGIPAAFWSGFACYALTLAACAWMKRGAERG